MSGMSVKVVGVGHGEAVSPPTEPYVSTSDVWREMEFHTWKDDSVVVGSWKGDVGWVRIDTWPANEVCVLLKGVVEIEDLDGSVRRFVAGESFFIPQGFAGIWRTVEPSEKVFVYISR